MTAVSLRAPLTAALVTSPSQSSKLLTKFPLLCPLLKAIIFVQIGKHHSINEVCHISNKKMSVEIF